MKYCKVLATAAIVWGCSLMYMNQAFAGPEAVLDLAAAVRVSYEGKLSGASGEALQGRHRLSFGLFRGGSGSEADSGTLLYGETVEVEVKDGCVAHLVGAGTPTFGSLSLPVLSEAEEKAKANQDLWLQVSVGDEQQVVLPRTRIVSSALAGISGDAQKLGGVAASEYLRKSDLDAAVQSAVRVAQIAKAAGTGYLSFIGGGTNHDASGGMSFIGGGTDNHATFWAAAVGGGSFNWATGAYSVVAGGIGNAAVHNRASVLGGESNSAEGYTSTVGGGAQNKASGLSSTVPGGQSNTAAGAWSFAAGRRAKSNAQGTLTWADSQDADFVNATPDSVLMRARNGLEIQGAAPDATLDIQHSGTGLAGRFRSVGASDGVLISASGTALDVSSTGDNALVVYSGAGPFFTPSGGFAVYGTTTNLNAIGVYGAAESVDANGVVGQAHNGSNGRGVWGISSAGFAGWFTGKVHVTNNVSIAGTLTKSAGSFKIDHPLDPENKYLSHSFVESPDMKNIYDGTVILDSAGEAVVELPEWFEALNKDFRYQLTAVGGAAPTLHVAQQIQENQFRIAGGSAGLTVSWQVTGIRKDAYAEAHPIPVEEEKPAKERGLYLHPEAHGQPASKGLEAEDLKRLEKTAGRAAFRAGGS